MVVATTRRLCCGCYSSERTEQRLRRWHDKRTYEGGGGGGGGGGGQGVVD